MAVALWEGGHIMWLGGRLLVGGALIFVCELCVLDTKYVVWVDI